MPLKLHNKSRKNWRFLLDSAEILQDSFNIIQLDPLHKIFEIFGSKHLFNSHCEIIPVEDPLRIQKSFQQFL